MPIYNEFKRYATRDNALTYPGGGLTPAVPTPMDQYLSTRSPLEGLNVGALDAWRQQQLALNPRAALTNQFLQTYQQNRDALVRSEQERQQRLQASVEEQRRNLVSRSEQAALAAKSDIELLTRATDRSGIGLSNAAQQVRDKFGIDVSASDAEAQINSLKTTLQSLIDSSASGNVEAAQRLVNYAEMLDLNKSNRAELMRQSRMVSRQIAAQKEANKPWYEKALGGLGHAAANVVGDIIGLPGGLARAATTTEGMLRFGPQTNIQSAQLSQQLAGQQGRSLETAAVDYMSAQGAADVGLLFTAAKTPFYAFQSAQLEGLSAVDQARAALGGVYGLGFVAGHGAARDAVERVNTEEERRALTEHGKLLTFGQYMGGYGGNLKQTEYDNYKDSWLLTVGKIGGTDKDAETWWGKGVTGTIDGIFNLAQDPTIWFIPEHSLADIAVRDVAVEGLDEAGRSAAYQAARANYIFRSEVGEAAIERTIAAVRDASTGVTEASVRGALGGSKVPQELVDNIIRAASVAPFTMPEDAARLAGQALNGEEGIRRLLTDAFVEGVWDIKAGPIRRGLIEADIPLLSNWGPPKSTLFFRLKNKLIGIASDSQRIAEGMYDRGPLNAIRNALHLATRGMTASEDAFVSDVVERNILPIRPGESIIPEETITEIAGRRLSTLASQSADNGYDMFVLTGDQVNIIWRDNRIPTSVYDVSAPGNINVDWAGETVGEVLDREAAGHIWIVRVADPANPRADFQWLVAGAGDEGHWISYDELQRVVQPRANNSGLTTTLSGASWVTGQTNDMANIIRRLREFATELDNGALRSYVNRLAITVDQVPFDTLTPMAQWDLIERLQEAELLLRMANGTFDHLSSTQARPVSAIVTDYLDAWYQHGTLTGNTALTKDWVQPEIGGILNEAGTRTAGRNLIDRNVLRMYRGLSPQDATLWVDELRAFLNGATENGNRVLEYFDNELERIMGLPVNRQAGPTSQLVYSIDAMLDDTQLGHNLAEEISSIGSRLERKRIITQRIAAYNAARPLWQRMGQGAARIALSMVERAPKAALQALISPIRSVNVNNIEKFAEDYGNSIGLSVAEREILARRAVSVATRVANGGPVNEVELLMRDLYSKVWERQGLNDESLRAWERTLGRETTGEPVQTFTGFILTDEQRAALQLDPQHYTVDPDTGNILTVGGQRLETLSVPQVASQASTNAPVITFEQLKEGIRNEFIARDPRSLVGQVNIFTGVGTAGENLTQAGRAIREIGNAFLEVEFSGHVFRVLEGRTIGDIANAMFKFWKVMVTTRLWMAPLSAAGTLAYERRDGEMTGEDIWRALGVGVGMGAFGFTRYALRMSIQNRLDAFLAHGFIPEEQIPIWASLFKRSEREIYGTARHALSPDPNTASWLTGWERATREMGSDWRIVSAQGNRREYFIAYDRVLNYQLQPETDEVVRLLLLFPSGSPGQGAMSPVAADLINTWLDTEDGALWIAKHARAGNSRQEALDATVRFVQTYAWHPDVAAARLETMGPGRTISRELLAEWERNGMLSPIVHSQAVDTKASRGILNAWKTFYENAAYGTTQAPRFREATFAAERSRTERALIARGVTPERARELSMESATLRTNEILFRYDNATRFAHAADWIMPFTGHRQFNAYMWTKLAIENPRNAIQLGVHGYQAFNALKDANVVQKDSFGTYRFRVPGSAQLSNLLGVDVSAELNAPVQGFLAVGSELGISAGHGLPFYASYVEQFTPHPGGLFWTAATNALGKLHPEFLDPATTPIPKGLYNYLYPMGVQEGAGIPLDVQVWGALLSDAIPPFAMLTEQGVDYNNRIRGQIVLEMIAEHARKTGNTDPGWFPSREEVDKQFLAVLTAWTFTRAVFPSAATLMFDDSTKVRERFAQWQKWNPGLSYSEQKKTYLEQHPYDYPFLTFAATKRPVPGAGTYAEWLDSDKRIFDKEEEAWMRYTNEIKYKSVDELRRDVEVFARRAEAADAYRAAKALTGLDREAALVEYRKNYPDQTAYFRNNALAEEDLAAILVSYPEGMTRDQAIDRWRKEWATGPFATVSKDEYDKMVTRIRRNIQFSSTGQYQFSAWTSARPGEVVYASIMRRANISSVFTNGDQLSASVMWEVAQLNPAEQVEFWKHARLALAQSTTMMAADPSAYEILDKVLKGKTREIYQNPEYAAVLKRSPQRLYRDGDYANDTFAQAEKGRSTLNALYEQRSRVYAERDAAYKAKDWGRYNVLKQQYNSLNGEILAFKNDLFKNRPVSVELHEAVAELAYLERVGGSKKARREAAAKIRDLYQTAPFQPVDEEVGYLNLTTAQRSAYVADLYNGLELPPDMAKAAAQLRGEGQLVRTKLYWERLTDFQKSLLEKQYPQSLIEEWKRITPDMAKGPGKQRMTIAQSEISWAYAMLKKYDQRNGMPKPAAYAEYLALPPQPAIRNDFLKKHPDVAEYVKRGGMANMPPVIRYIVQDIMIRNGKWDGEEKTIGEITDLAFAREQLDRYNRRVGPRPATFDEWLNMPSGQARADYMAAHPEIGDWIRLGPMSQMPEMYRDVVRDIMYRYNEWTTSGASDNMGQLMSEYFRVPSYARSEFLAKHPDLAAYFHASKSPEEQILQDKVAAYYAIPGTEARRAYLQVNPQVQQYMLDSRTRRYERFLNQVAQYMGQNPELFQVYLTQQEQVMKDLLAKFAEPHLVQEAPWGGGKVNVATSAEGGRVRARR